MKIPSSRLAVLLGRPNLLAQSKLMTAKDDEEEKGCFMAYARGIDPRGDKAADNVGLASNFLFY